MDRGYPSLYLMNWFVKNTGGFIITRPPRLQPAGCRLYGLGQTSETVTLKLPPNRRDIDYPDPDPP